MAYLGKQPLVGNYQVLDAIVATTTDTYALTKDTVAVFPQTPSNCIVSLNGVIQAPVDSYTISGSDIVFASALTGTDSIDFITVLGDVLSIGTPTDGTVSLAKLSATGTKDATTFLRGDNTFQTIGVNTPVFRVKRSATQSIPDASYTKVAFDSEDFDPQNTFASNKFTPAVAGYYYLGASIGFSGAVDFNDMLIIIYKNGSSISQGGSAFLNYDIRKTFVIDLANDTDYYEVYVYQNSGGAKDLSNNASITQFFGNKLIT
jgi:hypothetical protein